MHWLDYHHLLYFWTVAREGSIVRACEVLHLAQPTISSQLQQLEQQLGGKLFERAGRGLRLTELGKTVYGYGGVARLPKCSPGRHCYTAMTCCVCGLGAVISCLRSAPALRMEQDESSPAT
jgi:hypothetical protein